MSITKALLYYFLTGLATLPIFIFVAGWIELLCSGQHYEGWGIKKIWKAIEIQPSNLSDLACIILWPIVVILASLVIIFGIPQLLLKGWTHVWGKIVKKYNAISKKVHGKIYKWHLRKVLIELRDTPYRRRAWCKELNNIVQWNTTGTSLAFPSSIEILMARISQRELVEKKNLKRT